MSFVNGFKEDIKTEVLSQLDYFEFNLYDLVAKLVSKHLIPTEENIQEIFAADCKQAQHYADIEKNECGDVNVKCEDLSNLISHAKEKIISEIVIDIRENYKMKFERLES